MTSGKQMHSPLRLRGLCHSQTRNRCPSNGQHYAVGARNDKTVPPIEPGSGQHWPTPSITIQDPITFKGTVRSANRIRHGHRPCRQSLDAGETQKWGNLNVQGLNWRRHDNKEKLKALIRNMQPTMGFMLPIRTTPRQQRLRNSAH